MFFLIIIGLSNLFWLALTDMWEAEHPQDKPGCNMIRWAAFISYVWVIFNL